MRARRAGTATIVVRIVAARARGIAAACAAARARLNARTVHASQAPFAVNFPEGQVRQGAVFELGDDLLDDRVPAVGSVGADRVEGGVRDERVVPPGREQLALPGRGGRCGAQPLDASHDQPAGDLLGLRAGGERDELDLRDLPAAAQLTAAAVPSRTAASSPVVAAASSCNYIHSSQTVMDVVILTIEQ